MKGRLFIISAPSCAGKTSLLQALHKGPVGKSFCQYTTYTTKSPRKGDVPGKDFHFVSQEVFKAKIAKGDFIEWSNAYTNYYGTPRSILDDLNAGISYTLILDRTGAQKILKVIPDAILIWVYVSDVRMLAERIQKRGQDSSEQVKLRLQLACQEMEQEVANPMYHFHIKNDDFGKALEQLEKIVRDFLSLERGSPHIGQ